MEFTTLANWCGGPGFGWGGGQGFFSFMPFHMGGWINLLIIGLIIYFVARMFRKPAHETGIPTAEEVLRRRYAEGEIDSETYKNMKDDLHK